MGSRDIPETDWDKEALAQDKKTDWVDALHMTATIYSGLYPESKKFESMADYFYNLIRRGPSGEEAVRGPGDGLQQEG